MSCTVVALPVAIICYIVGGALPLAANYTIDLKTRKKSTLSNYEEIKYIGSERENEKECIPLDETTYKTVFADKDILIKTLTEHGGEMISQSDLTVKFKLDDFELNFIREKSDSPFDLRIFHKKSDSPQNEVENIDAEYKLNAQEQAYLQLVEKIKQNNMEIEEEEVQDDNTIVLTINLD